MKRAFILLIPMLLLVACGNTDDLEEVIAEQDEEIIEKQKEIDELKTEVASLEYELDDDYDEDTNEIEKELYLKMFNMLLNEYDEEHEGFDIEAGISLYNLMKSIASEDIEVAKNMKESIMDETEDESREVYSEFYDDVIELEETFSHLEWGD